jgi:hypothetical protein
MRRLAGMALAGMMIAPGAALASDAQHWEIVTVTANLGHGWRGSFENVTRSSEAKGFYELEQNLMLGHTLADKGAASRITVWLGYTNDPQYSHGTFTIKEQRFRQQVTFDRLFTLGPAVVSAACGWKSAGVPG